jgi:DNA mismatch repair protein MutS2
MNAHALVVLEFPHVKDLVAERASSPSGAARVRELAPTTARDWLDAEHARVGAMRALRGGADGWHPEPIPDAGAAVERLRVPGSVWTGEEFRGCALLLRSSRLTRAALTSEREMRPDVQALAPFIDRLVSARPSESAIDRAIDSDGSVRDEASPALRRVRRELRGAESELVQLLERAMARLESHYRVADMSVTVRNGRYVIPIRREGRAAVGGIVHDESGTRGTLFVEPPAAVEFGNRIRELEGEEVREVQRVLRELTDEVRPLADALATALEALTELDSLYARARFADDFGCTPAVFAAPQDGFALRNGRHPLLVARGGRVVPFDLELLPGERTLLLSGPNTGGKTVLLKAIGLMSAMAQSGIPAPVGAESRIAVFEDVFADIGDEQSIEASLSTFSAHLRNLGEILDNATARTLVLIDELGSGTDPAEGAALGGAILEELTRRGTITVATTHLGALKLLASELSGVINASLQFDEVALEPTYRLVKGIPGRSYGLSIARRLRLDDQVLARAEGRLPKGERDVAALLGDLERREAELAEREATAESTAERAAARLARVEVRERELRDAQRGLERSSRQEARRYLLEARAEVERITRELVAEGAATVDQSARDARRAIEARAAEHADAIAALESAGADVAPATPDLAALAPGDAVEVESLGGRAGRLIEFRGDDAVVAVGTMKLTVPRAGIRPTSRRAPRADGGSTLVGELPDERVSTEIDLRGMRADEAESALTRALDSAVRADLKALRIIHGKGTGALRERVAELLRGDARVSEYRLGAWNEGGAGVTVVSLR